MRSHVPAPRRATTALASLLVALLAGCGRDGAGPAAPSAPPPPDAAPASDLAPRPVPDEAPAAPSATPRGPVPTTPPPARPARLPPPIATNPPQPEALSQAGRTAYELARQHGKPLLAVLAPPSVEERRRRARLFEQLLRPTSIRAVLALADVAFVPESDATRFGLPPDAVPISFGVVVETDGSGRRPTAIPVANVLRVHAATLSTAPFRSPDDGIEVLERLDPSEMGELFLDRRRSVHDEVDEVAARDAFFLFLSTVREAIAGPHLARRVAAAREVVSKEAADRAVSAIERGIRLHPDDAHRLAAVVYAVGASRPSERDAAIDLLARATSRRLMELPPAGARWTGGVEEGPSDWCGTPRRDVPSPMLVLLPPEDA